MNFRTLIVTIVAPLCAAAALHAADSNRPSLTGAVTSGGAPVAGATVYVYTAGVRSGTSSYCPSCYADCGKRATTAADGTFTIESLDPELIFRILVVARGLEPTFIDKIDPAKGAIQATLKARPARAPDANALRGRVVDESGQPVVGAQVAPRGMKIGERRWWGDTSRQVDPRAITDTDGAFELVTTEANVAVDLQIRARGLVPASYELLPTGATVHELQLIRGATVRGRIVRDDGTPLAGAVVGLVQANRRTETFLGETIIAAGADGRFEFVNVKPGERYFVYGKMESLAGEGKAATVKEVMAGANDKSSDAGDLVASRGHTLRGTLRLSDGQPVPAGTRVLVSRRDAWDTQTVNASADGSFVFAGLPGERVSLSARVRGYRISPRNVCLDVLNCGSIEGKVDGEIDGLVLLLEPGEIDFNWLDAQPNQRQLMDDFTKVRQGRIRGAEHGPGKDDAAIARPAR